jgi:hypothetical protein
MSGFQIVIILVCAALGFGIVSNMIGSAKRQEPPEDRDQP